MTPAGARWWSQTLHGEFPAFALVISCLIVAQAVKIAFYRHFARRQEFAGLVFQKKRGGFAFSSLSDHQSPAGC